MRGKCASFLSSGKNNKVVVPGGIYVHQWKLVPFLFWTSKEKDKDARQQKIVVFQDSLVDKSNLEKN